MDLYCNNYITLNLTSVAVKTMHSPSQSGQVYSLRNMDTHCPSILRSMVLYRSSDCLHPKTYFVTFKKRRKLWKFHRFWLHVWERSVGQISIRINSSIVSDPPIRLAQRIRLWDSMQINRWPRIRVQSISAIAIVREFSP